MSSIKLVISKDLTYDEAIDYLRKSHDHKHESCTFDDQIMEEYLAKFDDLYIGVISDLIVDVVEVIDKNVNL